jgi:cell wall-associated NlpC family hydrolase
MNYIKYLQIPFHHLGRDFKGCDCFGLVRLFYREEFNITLPDYTDYEENWHLLDARRITKSYTKFGFSKKKDAPQYGDVLLLDEAGYPKHLGVVVAGGYFLHTTQSGTCCHSYKAGEYSQAIHSVFRFKKGLPPCR